MRSQLHSTRPLRRDAIRMGALTALGLELPSLLQSRAHAGQETQAKSCILIWLDGGPSHLETFDLKPDAPAEVRGPFEPIATNVPGIQISELLPLTAKVTNHLAIIRSMTSPLGEHGLANHYLLTGYKPTPALSYPTYGSVVSSQRQFQTALPAYVVVPESNSISGSGYLSSAHSPFTIKGDPSKAEFKISDLEFFPEHNQQRVDRRLSFLQQLDAAQREHETIAERTSPAELKAQFAQAYRLMTSPEAKRAFDLSDEPAKIRERFGLRSLGQSCLLARRLVERGVSFVTVNNVGWDTHDSLVLQLKLGYSGAKVGVGLLPTFDQGFSALIADLSDRGLLDETLVIAMGEFGRTPKLNARGGRDHWPRVFSVVLAGGGVRGGQVIGSSDRTGESPLDNPITPNDLAYSIYRLLGIDPNRELRTVDGRPVRINQGGNWITQLT